MIVEMKLYEQPLASRTANTLKTVINVHAQGAQTFENSH